MGNAAWAEQATYLAPLGMGGVEMLAATFVRHSFSRHFHEEYAVGVIERGAMRFHYLGENMVAADGMVNLVIPGEAHDGHAAMECGWSYRMFYLSPDLVREAARQIDPKAAYPVFRQGVLHDPSLAARVRQTHLALADTTAPLMERESRLLGLLTHWIGRHALGFSPSPLPTPEHDAVDRARALIHDRLPEDVSLAELAAEARLSPYHLIRVFTAELGVTPHEYLTQTRLEKARRLLTTPARLADIAQEAGFCDQSHLSRQFKRRFGVPPGAYRKIVQNF